MKLRGVSFLFVAMLSVLFVLSCSKSSTSPNETVQSCDGVDKTFAANVNPLIQTFCNQAGCHNTGSINGPGPLTNYTQVFNARSDIRAAVKSGLMPQNTTLSASQKNTIICWIDSGAPNN
ncbi:MAG TPA: hypothetical protein VK644_14205 [Chitinophagaceae bacterium]|nr:hypothetical protein [Chitinophagaceae bacterium]